MDKKLLPLLIVAGVILVALGIVFGRTLDNAVNPDDEAALSSESSVSSSEESSSLSSTGTVVLETKEFFCGGQVPENWNVYVSSGVENGEFADADVIMQQIKSQEFGFSPIAFAAAAGEVKLNVSEDPFRNQIDVLVLPGSDVTRVVQALRSETLPGLTWSQEVIGGHSADVLASSDTIGGAGSMQLVFLAWKERAPEGDESFDKGLIIQRGNSGDADGEVFGAAYQNFLETLVLEGCMGPTYPLVEN